jgi:hypothetical protein
MVKCPGALKPLTFSSVKVENGVMLVPLHLYLHGVERDNFAFYLSYT